MLVIPVVLANENDKHLDDLQCTDQFSYELKLLLGDRQHIIITKR